jgi:hypothetical protein
MCRKMYVLINLYKLYLKLSQSEKNSAIDYHKFMWVSQASARYFFPF